MVGSVIGAAGSILGGKSAKKAASAQAASAAQAQKMQEAQYAQSRSDQMPWLSTGGAAIGQLGYLMGLTPQNPYTIPQYQGYMEGGADTQAQKTYDRRVKDIDRQNKNLARRGLPLIPYPDAPSSSPAGGNWGAPPSEDYAGGGFGSLASPFDMATFEQDPSYAFRLSEGQKALERSQASRGNLLSGAAGKAMMGYGQDMASQEYGAAYNRYNQNQSNLFNRLGSLAGVGQTSAGTLGGLGANAAGQAGEYATQAGNARAAGAVGQGNAWSTGLGTLGQGLTSYFGGGGGGGDFNYIPYGGGSTFGGGGGSNIIWNS